MPLIGIGLILLCPRFAARAFKWIAAAATVAADCSSRCGLYQGFDTDTTALQFVEKYPWISAYHIDYFMGVDGISISMVLLTALICFISVFASFGIEQRAQGLFRAVAAARYRHDGRVRLARFLPVLHLLGSDAAADVLPDRHLGRPRREYAAIKFFLYTLFGSVLILLAMLGLYYYNSPVTFDMTELAANASSYSMNFQRIVWIALFIGFAIKIPAFPFHTWLPDAHVEAPTAISVILAGVLLKMGTYGILRINFAILPAASHELAWSSSAAIGTINIVYGALCAMGRPTSRSWSPIPRLATWAT